MNGQQHKSDVFVALSSSRFIVLWIFATVCVAIAGVLCAGGGYREAAVLGAASVGTSVLVLAPISIQSVLIIWFVTTPIASFYVRFPTDRSILTYNRYVFALIVVMLLLKSTSAMTPKSRMSTTAVALIGARHRAFFSVSRFEIAWALLSIIALASCLAKSNNIAYAARLAVDSFWLPLMAFHLARTCVNPKTVGKSLVSGSIVLSLFLIATGAFEFATGRDLFAYKGSEIVREGERRINGPFATDSSFAIISMLLFLLLLVAPRLFNVRFDRTARLAYSCALGGAAVAALLPLFRIVAVALVGCWVLLHWLSGYRRPASTRFALRRVPLGAVLTGITILLVGWVATTLPSVAGSRLTEARTVYGRLATWQAAASTIIDNPVVGVGLANYADYFDASHYYSDEAPEEVSETRAADSPHSNVLWIGAELGIIALAIYIAANLYLVSTGWRALRRAITSPQRLAAACFLALIAAYWIPGLTLASGYYSDLNLYLLFLLGLLSRVAESPQPLPFSTEQAVARLDD